MIIRKQKINYIISGKTMDIRHGATKIVIINNCTLKKV